MLFGAGMGIGLLFYGIAEPISHFTDPLTGKAGTEESAARYAIFVFPLGSLSMVTIRNGCFNNCIFHIPQTKGSTIGATVTPLFNRSKNSPIGKTVDILAVLATVFGIVPSVGIGAQQIAGGLSYLFPSIHNTLLTQAHTYRYLRCFIFNKCTNRLRSWD